METRTIVIATAIQFIVMLGFSVVMPMGPYIALDLELPVAQLGLLASAYALAGFCAGLFSAGILDRFDRRCPLIAALTLLGLATLGASRADSLPMLMAMRAIAGASGGVCTALLTAIIADVVSVERRGRAYSFVLGTGPLVSVIGLPLVIQIAATGSWRIPLVLLGCASLILTLIVRLGLPPLASHLHRCTGPSPSFLRNGLRRPPIRAAIASVFAMSFAFALLTANNATLLLLNLHLPHAWLAIFYMSCGTLTFLLLRLVGHISDRQSPFMFMVLAIIGFSGGIFFSYIFPPTQMVGVVALFVTIMSISVLSVSMMTLALHTPRTSERAGFGALLGALQNLASAIGAGLSSSILVDLPGPRLGNVEIVGFCAIGAAAITLIMGKRLQRLQDEGTTMPTVLLAQPSEQPAI